MNIILLGILFIFLILILFINNNCYENFDNDNDIDYYVIHLKDSSPERKENILNNQEILGKKINMFDAVYGKHVDLNNLKTFDRNINFNFNYEYIAEVGCYLSHLMLIKKSMENKKKYTVIFEDDFVLEDKNIHDKIEKIIYNVKDFDIIYLGNLNDNYDINKKISENIYEKNNNISLIGTHAYIINNKNINKFYNYLTNIDKPIDRKFEQIINENIIKGYVHYPSLVSQDNIKFKSEIRDRFRTYVETVYRKIIKLLN
jgi:GR25 family glycosyltransferase involved in LPS biosynthesis